ncbi:serine protease [Mortierella antarctica]|nr:serine protease [Mortierella alpina]KAF9984738.1 serine protease [Mortierella antarctica]
MLLKLSTVAALVLVAASSAAAQFAPCHSEALLAPLLASDNAEVIPDSYFVVFKNGIRAQDNSGWVQDLHQRDVSVNGLSDLDSGVRHVFDMGSFQGLAGRFSPEVLDEIRRNPDVDYIERDQMVYASDTQKSAPWGLARISHRKKLTLRTFNKYEYNPKGGKGVTVFVIDTGINFKHKEFEGRASWGKTIPYGDPDSDDNGHGTHCAGTIASRAYGVSKKAEVVAVKVLRSNGSGTMADVIAGIDFAVKSHKSLRTQQGSKYRGSVANMSLGGGKSRPLDSAVSNAIAQGLHFAVAAGNDNRDACDVSPAGVENAITVAASNRYDQKAYFSNYGRCVDVFAPGQDIESTWTGSDSAKNTISGTSMASPHVAGLVAYYLSLAPQSDSGFNSGPISTKEMKDLLKKSATQDALTGVNRETPNLLIYNSVDKERFYAW